MLTWLHDIILKYINAIFLFTGCSHMGCWAPSRDKSERSRYVLQGNNEKNPSIDFIIFSQIFENICSLYQTLYFIALDLEQSF